MIYNLRYHNLIQFCFNHYLNHALNIIFKVVEYFVNKDVLNVHVLCHFFPALIELMAHFNLSIILCKNKGLGASPF